MYSHCLLLGVAGSACSINQGTAWVETGWVYSAMAPVASSVSRPPDHDEDAATSPQGTTQGTVDRAMDVSEFHCSVCFELLLDPVVGKPCTCTN